MNKLKNWKYYQLLRNIFKFEIFYKFIVLFILSPMIRYILNFYLDKVTYGIAFNFDMIYQFLSWQGILVALGLFIIITLLIYYEYDVIIQLIGMDYQHQNVSLRIVMLKCFKNMKSIHWGTLLICGLYLCILLPLVHIGYLNSYIFRWEIPQFVFKELKLTFLGNITIILIYVFYLSLFFMMIFVPIYIFLKNHSIIQSTKESLTIFKKIPLKHLIQLIIIHMIWIIIESSILTMSPYALLTPKDFNFYFLKYVFRSTSFRMSVFQYLLLFIMSTIAMIFYIRYLISLVDAYDPGFIYINDLPIETEHFNETLIHMKQKIINSFIAVKNKIMSTSFYIHHQKIIKLVSIGVGISVLIVYFDTTPYVHEPWIIGHRGSMNAVENTYEAVEDAANNQADYAEIDIQLSSDGIPVVFHDGSLSRLSSSSSLVSELTYSQLKKIELHQNGMEGHIISLEDLILKMKDNQLDIGLLIELKSNNINRNEMVDKVIEVIKNENYEKKCIYMSTDFNTVSLLKEKESEWWVGYCIYGSIGTLDSAFWDMNINFLAMEENRATNHFIQEAVQYMLPLYIWTVDDEKSMNQYLNMGVSGLITNDTKLGKTVLSEFEQNHHHQYYYSGKEYPN